jgi:hypothetical protein
VHVCGHDLRSDGDGYRYRRRRAATDTNSDRDTDRDTDTKTERSANDTDATNCDAYGTADRTAHSDQYSYTDTNTSRRHMRNNPCRSKL